VQVAEKCTLFIDTWTLLLYTQNSVMLIHFFPMHNLTLYVNASAKERRKYRSWGWIYLVKSYVSHTLRICYDSDKTDRLSRTKCLSYLCVSGPVHVGAVYTGRWQLLCKRNGSGKINRILRGISMKECVTYPIVGYSNKTGKACSLLE
jgi:hypothetical protein